MVFWMMKFWLQFKGIGNVVIGVIIGVGLVKIYYEILDIVDGNIIIKKEIEDIIVRYDNFKCGYYFCIVSF